MSNTCDQDPAVAAPPDDPWRVEHEPTNLVALWRGDAAPTPEEVVTALRRHFEGAVEILDEPAPEDGGIAWCRVVELTASGAVIIVWCEASAAAPPVDLQNLGILETRWVLGFETLLRPEDPLSDFCRLMRFVLRDLPGVPAVLDVNTTTWYTREQLDDLLGADDLEPPADVLWVNQVVTSTHENRDLVWLHTHGLARCGVPDLELLEVPGECAATAAGLLNDVAALLLETTLPPPGAPLTIGAGLAVALQPWSAVVPYIEDGVPGGMKDRAEDTHAHLGSHVGSRAVVCATTAVGSFRKLWVWPREVTERLMRDEVCLYQTDRATERQSRLARHHWKEFARAFAEERVAPASFGVKAGFEQGHAPGLDSEQGATGREHLWFEVCRLDAARVQGRLVNQPHDVAALQRGDLTWIDLSNISDWRVMNESGSFGPEDVPAMWRAMRRGDDGTALSDAKSTGGHADGIDTT